MVDVPIAVCVKVAEYTVGPILRPLLRPFKYLYEYRSNLENLKINLQKLEMKSGEVQGFTYVDVEPPAAIKSWHEKITNIRTEVDDVLTGQQNPQQQSMNWCQWFSCFKLKQCYQHRKHVAQLLKDIAQLHDEATKSNNQWVYISNLENLKRKKEDLVAVSDARQISIKKGEEALPKAKDWLDRVNVTINEIIGIITLEEIPQCCPRLNCLKCRPHREDVASKLEDVCRLLKEEREFEEFSTPTEETIYQRCLDDLKKKVENLLVEKQRKELSSGSGDPCVRLWQKNAEKIIVKVSQLDEEDYSRERREEVDRLWKEVVGLFEEAKGLKRFRELKDLSIQVVPVEPGSQSSVRNSQPLKDNFIAG